MRLARRSGCTRLKRRRHLSVHCQQRSKTDSLSVDSAAIPLPAQFANPKNVCWKEVAKTRLRVRYPSPIPVEDEPKSEGAKPVVEFIRPDRQQSFSGHPHYDWPKPTRDRDTITVDRISSSKPNGESSALQPKLHHLRVKSAWRILRDLFHRCDLRGRAKLSG